MLKLLIVFTVLAVVPSVCAAQGTVTVTSVKANLRGTPSVTGIVVTTVEYGETFELIKDKAPWYLVQTPKYVGWLHGNGISLGSGEGEVEEFFNKHRIVPAPKKTGKSVTAGDSPFQREYVGGQTAEITVINATNRILTLLFGGVKYTVSAGGERVVEVDGGRYEFSASVPSARPTGGVQDFEGGYRHSWRFFIVRRSG